MTLQQALHQAANRIDRRDAETLLAHLLHQDRTWLLLHSEDELPADLSISFKALVDRRARREPLQYLTGTQEFYGLPLAVTRHTLIPRPETEHLVEAVLHWAATRPTPLRLLDVGTGTGAIAIALAHHLPQAQLFACDISPEALAVATQNAVANGLGDRIHFILSDLLTALPQMHFDAIISNPPYVPSVDAPTLQAEVREHEPHLALFAGQDGLDLYRRLVPQARAALRNDGLLAMEIGFGLREALHTLLQGWHNVRFVQDYAGIPRVVLAELAEEHASD